MTYLIFGIAAIISFCAAGVVLFLYLLVKHTPVDRAEDVEADDRRVRQVRDSMRGTL